MKKSSLVLSVIFFLSLAGGAVADDSVTIAPAVTLSKADAQKLIEINKLLHERQATVDKIMAKYGLKRLRPQVPNYSKMSENSVQALLNQLDYTALAEKVGATVPPRPDLETGVALKNNRFLHFYNNQILRSIATKLGAESPAPISFEKGSLEEHCWELVHQNNEIAHRIAVKIGVETP